MIYMDVATEHVAYRRYLMCMCDHGCECVALTFEQWERLWLTEPIDVGPIGPRRP
jgi:hypothetical protein